MFAEAELCLRRISRQIVEAKRHLTRDRIHERVGMRDQRVGGRGDRSLHLLQRFGARAKIVCVDVADHG